MCGCRPSPHPDPGLHGPTSQPNPMATPRLVPGHPQEGPRETRPPAHVPARGRAPPIRVPTWLLQMFQHWKASRTDLFLGIKSCPRSGHLEGYSLRGQDLPSAPWKERLLRWERPRVRSDPPEPRHGSHRAHCLSGEIKNVNPGRGGWRSPKAPAPHGEGQGHHGATSAGLASPPCLPRSRMSPRGPPPVVGSAVMLRQGRPRRKGNRQA